MQRSMPVFCDNSSVIHLSKNPTHHKKTKHIVIKLHFIKYKVTKRVVKLVKTHTDQNPTDMLTKVVPTTKLKLCLNIAGLSHF